MKYVTETESNHKDLDKKSAEELLRGINQEDKTVAFAVEQAIPAMTEFVEKALPRMKEGGRLFYIGAGTSGRLGIVDASEIPPTYGMAPGVVVGIMAGGDYAIRNAVEGAEDDFDQSWVDLQAHNITPNDIVVGIAASGRTPYVIGGLVPGHVLVSGENGNGDFVLGDLKDLGQELVAHPDGFVLEIVVEGPVAHHLEEGEVAGISDFVYISRADALLAVHQTVSGGMLLT